MNEGRVAAFFDLDRTLIDVNSAVLYARYERKAGRISNWQLLRTVASTLLYHLSLLDMEKAYANALAHYRGAVEEDLVARTKEFFAAEVEPRLQPGARSTLEDHRKAGHPLVMLSSSTSFQADIASRAWGLDDWIANRFDIENGRMLGTFKPPLCYGSGKVALARQWAEAHDVDLSNSYFYSDSFSDVPMFNEVGHPVVVNPDPRLKVYAQRRGWVFQDWRRSQNAAFTAK